MCVDFFKMHSIPRYDPQAEKFVRFFERCSQWNPVLASDALQTGGALPVFYGRRRFPAQQQYGVGLLDWLKRIAGYALPVALSGASTFLGQARAAQAEGKSLGEAAKAALAPAAEAAMSETATQIAKARKPKQEGTGRKRRKKTTIRPQQQQLLQPTVVPSKAARAGLHVYKSAAPAGPSVKYNF
jgi:hypothetical protein